MCAAYYRQKYGQRKLFSASVGVLLNSLATFVYWHDLLASVYEVTFELLFSHTVWPVRLAKDRYQVAQNA